VGEHHPQPKPDVILSNAKDLLFASSGRIMVPHSSRGILRDEWESTDASPEGSHRINSSQFSLTT
jgi:hypothetical protein